MVLVYFMDGVKYEMVDRHMPFLAQLNKKKLISDFGYSCACHATMYTGRYIEEHNTWFVWKKGENSPYKWINRVPLLKYINCIPVKIICSRIAGKLHKNTAFPGIPMLVSLPLKYWGLFEPTEDVFWTDPRYKEGMPNLFTILKENGVKHQMIALSKSGDPFAEEAGADYANNEFIYYFIGQTDNYMHKYGEDGMQARQFFAKVDDFIKKTFEKACREQKDVTVICFSDHGHIDVEDPKIDINDYFRPEGLNINKYIHLIESTFARFWFREEEERKEVIGVLRKMEEEGKGFILTQEDYDRYHLNFGSNEHGDLIFHLKAPREFTKTIWGFGRTVKSMHGYEPTLPKHYGVFAANKKLPDIPGVVSLVDILPSIMVQLGIDREPYVLRGENVVYADERS
jgi:hypothetical protein